MMTTMIFKALQSALDRDYFGYTVAITSAQLHHASPQRLTDHNDAMIYIVQFTCTSRPGWGIAASRPNFTTAEHRLATAVWNGKQFVFPTTIIVASH